MESIAEAAEPLTNTDVMPLEEAGGLVVPELPVKVLVARSGWHMLDFKELWRYRELLFFLTWRDVKVRYKQTFFGAAWAVLQPLANMIVLSILFSGVSGKLANVEHYPLFLFAGLLPWTFFATAVSSAGQSIVGGQNLVTKVYFPRLIIPMGAVGAAVIDFAIAFSMLGLLMLWYQVWPSWSFLLTPFMALGIVVLALAVGTLLSALTVAYRDFRHIVPFLVQLWMFATPSVFLQADTALSSKWQLILPLNPAYGLIANFRAAALGTPFDGYSLMVSGGVTLALLFAAGLYFRRVERGFADII
ncbi:MAG TPA: ABC transporter permease [Gemmataceae bacterium]|jgi:lipopolysaccharide transport system permease protein|nr:ABC transporter permease [Gemmataceae bacterium]